MGTVRTSFLPKQGYCAYFWPIGGAPETEELPKYRWTIIFGVFSSDSILLEVRSDHCEPNATTMVRNASINTRYLRKRHNHGEKRIHKYLRKRHNHGEKRLHKYLRGGRGKKERSHTRPTMSELKTNLDRRQWKHDVSIKS